MSSFLLFSTTTRACWGRSRLTGDAAVVSVGQLDNGAGDLEGREGDEDLCEIHLGRLYVTRLATRFHKRCLGLELMQGIERFGESELEKILSSS